MQEGETFHERLERLRSMDVPPAAVVAAEDAADPGSNRSKRRLRKLRAAAAGKAAQPGKRPGKRQRRERKTAKNARNKAKKAKKAGEGFQAADGRTNAGGSGTAKLKARQAPLKADANRKVKARKVGGSQKLTQKTAK